MLRCSNPPLPGVEYIISSSRIFFTRNFLHHPHPYVRFFTMSQRQRTDTANGTSSYKKVLNIDSINPAVREAKYAVRGELAIRANQLEAQLKEEGDAQLPFKDVVHSEIGNPQALDQKPLTFIRQVGAHVWG